MILFAKLASPEEPQELEPAHRFPLTSRYVPFKKLKINKNNGNKDVACNNGSSCVESKIFYYFSIHKK